MRSNKQIAFTLVARLVKGQEVEDNALAQALFSQIAKREVLGK